MKNRKALLAVLTGLALSSYTIRVTTEDDASLKGALGDKFSVGMALNTRQSSGVDTTAVKIVRRHFNLSSSWSPQEKERLSYIFARKALTLRC